MRSPPIMCRCGFRPGLIARIAGAERAVARMSTVTPASEWRKLATRVMERLDALARISDEPGRLTRTFCSPAMRRANELVGSWMREAGMTVRLDAIGNVVGHY